MNDLANSSEFKDELMALRDELEEIRLEIAASQEPASYREPVMHSPTGNQKDSCAADIADSIATTTSTPLENLQRLLAKSRGEE